MVSCFFIRAPHDRLPHPCRRATGGPAIRQRRTPPSHSTGPRCSSWRTPSTACPNWKPGISVCRACPRLVSWREEVAQRKRRAFADQPYWGRPVPGWGSARPRLFILGLAPAANGANRTGRVFTGDRSGDRVVRRPVPGRPGEPIRQHRRRGWIAGQQDSYQLPRCVAHRRKMPRRPPSGRPACRGWPPSGR